MTLVIGSGIILVGLVCFAAKRYDPERSQAGLRCAPAQWVPGRERELGRGPRTSR